MRRHVITDGLATQNYVSECRLRQSLQLTFRNIPFDDGKLSIHNGSVIPVIVANFSILLTNRITCTDSRAAACWSKGCRLEKKERDTQSFSNESIGEQERHSDPTTKISDFLHRFLFPSI